MPRIDRIRCVLLSAPYSVADDPEILECFPNGPKRTVGIVEVTLETGTVGLGEGYLAVFAPEVFRSITELVAPHLVGKEAFEVSERCRDIRRVCDYWSLQGAARHVLSAIEVALQDARARALGMPVHQALGGAKAGRIAVYGSGGCCASKDEFRRELDWLADRGVGIYKIRSVAGDVRRTAWVLEEAGSRGIRVAVDMCQNLADPPQAPEAAATFVGNVHALTGQRIYFLEEAVGPAELDAHLRLRELVDVPVAGGEIITTPREMTARMAAGAYAIAQPDTSVIGGLGAVMDIFGAAASTGTEVVVHAWGGPVAIMASWQAAFAGGGRLVELPMLPFELADHLLGDQARIKDGAITRSEAPGLGLQLSPEIEALFPYDPEAVYCCLPTAWKRPPDDVW